MSKKFIRITTNEPDVIEKIQNQNMFAEGSINVFNSDYICMEWHLKDHGVIDAVLIKEVDV